MTDCETHNEAFFLCAMCNVGSWLPTRDRIHVACVGSAVLTTGPPGSLNKGLIDASNV